MFGYKFTAFLITLLLFSDFLTNYLTLSRFRRKERRRKEGRTDEPERRLTDRKEGNTANRTEAGAVQEEKRQNRERTSLQGVLPTTIDNGDRYMSRH